MRRCSDERIGLSFDALPVGVKAVRSEDPVPALYTRQQLVAQFVKCAVRNRLKRLKGVQGGPPLVDQRLKIGTLEIDPTLDRSQNSVVFPRIPSASVSVVTVRGRVVDRIAGNSRRI